MPVPRNVLPTPHKYSPHGIARRLHRQDRRAFEAVAQAHLPGLEFVLPRLSRVADHSVLWFATAGVLAATRHPRLRRAALRGTIALGLTSPMVNLVGKQAFRRRRPVVDLVPPVRIRWRLPTSPAFPSGHSASAAAFATGVALEAPLRAATPVGLLAAAVCFSRVYNGAHYPGDVLAGMSAGVAAGFVTKVIWPSRPPVAEIACTTPLPVSGQAGERTGEDGLGLVAVVNPSAGSGDGVADVLGRELPAAEIVEIGPDDDVPALMAAAAERARVLAVAGGDGTVNAGAQAAVDHGIPLLTVPGGTLDHFSRALGIDTPSDAIAAYRSGCLAKVDVGCVEQPDGSAVLFLNTASFGAYTDMVDQRERLAERIGKWPALAVAAVRVLRRAQPVEVIVDGRPRHVWLAFVGNCEFGSQGTAPTWRRRLDDGLLDVRMIATGRRADRLRALLAVLGGGAHLSPEYSAWRASSLEVASADGDLRLARDGETCWAARSVVFSKRQAALAVFAPDRT